MKDEFTLHQRLDRIKNEAIALLYEHDHDYYLLEQNGKREIITLKEYLIGKAWPCADIILIISAANSLEFGDDYLNSSHSRLKNLAVIEYSMKQRFEQIIGLDLPDNLSLETNNHIILKQINTLFKRDVGVRLFIIIENYEHIVSINTQSAATNNEFFLEKLDIIKSWARHPAHQVRILTALSKNEIPSFYYPRIYPLMSVKNELSETDIGDVAAELSRMHFSVFKLNEGVIQKLCEVLSLSGKDAKNLKRLKINTYQSQRELSGAVLTALKDNFLSRVFKIKDETLKTGFIEEFYESDQLQEILGECSTNLSTDQELIRYLVAKKYRVRDIEKVFKKMKDHQNSGSLSLEQFKSCDCSVDEDKRMVSPYEKSFTRDALNDELFRNIDNCLVGHRYTRQLFKTQCSSLVGGEHYALNSGKPKQVFAFFGPTAVGKTLLAGQLVDFLTEKGVPLFRINHDQMTSVSAVNYLGGSQVYTGYGDRSCFVDAVEDAADQNAGAIVLWVEEWEKARDAGSGSGNQFQILNILLSMLGSASLVSQRTNLESKLDQCIIIMTSNLANKELAEMEISSRRDLQQAKKVLKRHMLERSFPPELVGRIVDNAYIFGALNEKEIEEIIEKELKVVLEKVNDRFPGLQDRIRFDVSLKTYMLFHYRRNRELGARTVSKEIDNISGMLRSKIEEIKPDQDRTMEIILFMSDEEELEMKQIPRQNVECMADETFYVNPEFQENSRGRFEAAEEQKLDDAQVEGVAVHETGHLVCAAAVGDADAIESVEISELLDPPDQNGRGSVRFRPEKIVRIFQQEILRDIIISFGSAAAEKLVLGQQTLGSSADRERARLIAESLVTKHGRSESISYIGDTSCLSEKLKAEIESKTEQILGKLFRCAERIIAENEVVIKEIVDCLLTEKKLTGTKLEAFCKRIKSCDVNKIEIKI